MGAMRQAFDRYLVGIFGLRDAGHVHFGAVIDGMEQRFVHQALFEVEEHARKICSAVAAERHSKKAHKAMATFAAH